MNRDIRDTPLYKEVQTFFTSLRQPGTGQISDAAEIHASPDGKRAAFAATYVDKFEGAPTTRICEIELESGTTRVLTLGPNTDRLPKYSPDGRHIAFLSDRHKAADFQLYLLHPASGAAQATAPVDGWVEYLHWSPDGKRILLGVAGHGADVAGGQGAVTTQQMNTLAASWMPSIDSGAQSHQWRRAWIYDVETDRVRQVSPADINVWEAVWCGNDAVAVVASPGPAEGLWYSAQLYRIGVHDGACREIHAPADQVGWPACSPSGRNLAFVAAICSDRWIVAGDLHVLDTVSNAVTSVNTRGMDVSHTEWISERLLLLAGVRGGEMVTGIYDAQSASFTETWANLGISVGGHVVKVSGVAENGDCVLIGEGYDRAPEVALVRRGEYRTVRSFDLGYSREAKAIHDIQHLSWNAPDGLEIQGWVLRPHGAGPHPLVMVVHGGPISNWRPTYLGRPRGAPALMLLKPGFAVFFPNPRGSSSRGQDFARRVVGDPGGADTYDYLSGLDHLVRINIADPKRLGVTGGSYGGFMSSWLITQDSRFAAAVPIAPATNKISQHLTCNIPQFIAMFWADSYHDPRGRYFQRSPIMHAHKARTPTLNLCGALDRCTPPTEAMQFHNALLENGVKSVLVTYPEEGHGVRKFPAAIDYVTRIVAWFEEHLTHREPQ